MPREAPQIRVLDSAEAVAKAMADAAMYAIAHPAPELSLEHMGRTMLDSNRIEELARAGQPMLERLRVIAAGTGAPAVAASACLVRLGQPAYATRVSDLLATETPPALGECFKWIGMNGELVRGLPDLDRLRRHVEPIAQTPGHPDRVPALRAAFELETRIASVEIVDALVRATDGVRYPEGWISYALGRIARRGGDPGLAAARALLQPPFLEFTSVSRAARARDPRLLPDVERVLSSGPKKLLFSDALLALAYVQGMDAMPRLLEALEDPEMASTVSTAIGVAADGTGDESIVAALSMAAAGGRAGAQPAVAMACIGGPLAMRTLAGLCTRVNVHHGMTAVWRATGITASSAIRRFVDASVIPAMPTDDELRAAAESPYAWEPNDLWLFLHLLEKSGRVPDATGEDIDARDVALHPRVIERFARAAGDMLPIEHLSQINGRKDDRGDQDVEIQFVCGGRVYQVTTKVNGRYFNFAAVRALLNGALQDRGCEERFTRMQNLDTERLIFGPRAAVEAACDDICLPHGTERTEHTAWQDRVQQIFLEAAGPASRAGEAIDFGFHVFRPTRAGAFPHDAVNQAVTGALGSATPVTVTAGAGWTEIEVRITRDQFTAAGAEAIESLFVSLCDLTEAHLGRTLSGSDWARITEGELAGAVEALDWLQYFGPRFSKRVRGRTRGLTASQSPRGAEVVRLDMDPLAPLWLPRKEGARAASIYRPRPFPESAQAELDPEVRLKKVSPPEPVAWKPEERDAMLRARGATLQAIEKGMANGRLFDRFRRRYLAEELDSARLDRIATWLAYYDSAAATAAFRAVARLHDAHPAAASMGDDALEGCVKLVAWGGDDRPLLERELLVEHIVDPRDPGMAIFAKQSYEPGAMGGLIKMTAAMQAMCKCPRCTEMRKKLERPPSGGS